MYAYNPMNDLLALDGMTNLPDEQESRFHSICKRCVLKDGELQMLYNILPLTFPVSSNVKLDICSIFMKYSDVKHNDVIFISAMSNRSKLFVAIVNWKNSLYIDSQIQPANDLQNCPSCENIIYFASISFTADGHMHNAMYVAVSRYMEHCKKNVIGKPAEVWSTSFENDGRCYFLPIDCLLYHCAYCIRKIDVESLLVIVPLIE